LTALSCAQFGFGGGTLLSGFIATEIDPEEEEEEDNFEICSETLSIFAATLLMKLLNIFCFKSKICFLALQRKI
jgi:hypothetical protein